MPVRALDEDGQGNSGEHRQRHPVRRPERGHGDQPQHRWGQRRRRGAQRRDRAGGPAQHRRGVSRPATTSSDNDANPVTPCMIDPPAHNNICVAAVTPAGARSDFSNFGATTVDLGAPGGDGSGTPAGDVLSAKPGVGQRCSARARRGTSTASGPRLGGGARTGGSEPGRATATRSPTAPPGRELPPERDNRLEVSSTRRSNLSGRQRLPARLLDRRRDGRPRHQRRSRARLRDGGPRERRRQAVGTTSARRRTGFFEGRQARSRRRRRAAAT